MPKFQESQLAHQLLDSLTGIEVGGAAHNSFGLSTINVDRVSHNHPDFAPYASEQMRLCGEIMPVDIVAPGDCIPVPDQSADFVISSHVIEHFYDPISAIKEWMRIATKYIFIICPHRDALDSDRDKPLTELEEHIERFRANLGVSLLIEPVSNKGTVEELMGEARRRLTKKMEMDLTLRNTDEHHSRWTLESFCDMCDWITRQDFGAGWEVCVTEARDSKVENGFTVVLKKNEA